jgi:hypothetical protein
LISLLTDEINHFSIPSTYSTQNRRSNKIGTKIKSHTFPNNTGNAKSEVVIDAQFTRKQKTPNGKPSRVFFCQLAIFSVIQMSIPDK